jgi:hypothetical protein
VRLKVIKTADSRREFGVKATRAFRTGEYIYELAGLVPTENLAEHTNLSLVVPHVDQGEVLEPRVFFGPIRFINHHCVSYNVQVSKSHPKLPVRHLNFTVRPTIW